MYRNAKAVSVIFGLFAILCALVLYGLLPRRPEPILHSMVRLAPGDYPVFSDDLEPDSFLQSLSRSRDYLSRVSPEKKFHYGPDTYAAGHLLKSVDLLISLFSSNPSPQEINAFIRKNFAVYRAAGAGPTRDMLFTGYYEPLLKGSLTPSKEFPHPLYKVPDDVVTADLGLFSSSLKGRKISGMLKNGKLLPYHSRKEIDGKKALAGKGLELAWLADPVDAFFLQIQGSGQVLLEDGKALHVHYAGENGRAYRSVGTLLIREEKVGREEMSMQAIRQYLADHPEDRDRILFYNDSYVFFQLTSEGPLGSIGQALTPGRSIALDYRVFPMAAPVFLSSKKPGPGPEQSYPDTWIPFSRFACAQDTGGAIRGFGRADLFWGSGPLAEYGAGHMKEPGMLYFLVALP